MKYLALWGLIILLSSHTGMAQQTIDSLPTLTKEDYNQWQSLSQVKISPEGTWVTYRIIRVEGNDTLFIQSAKGTVDSVYSIAFGSNLIFSDDGHWAAVRTGFSEKQLEKKKEKKEEVRYNMVLVNLSTGKMEKFRDVRAYRFSKNSGFLAMHTYPAPKSKKKSSDLIVRNLNTGTTQNFGNVTEWSFNKTGNRLAFITDAAHKAGNGVSLLDPSENRISVLASDTNTFEKLNWEKEGKALAFLQAIYDTGYSAPTHKIIAVKNVENPDRKLVFDPYTFPGFPDSMRIKETTFPQWSKDLSILYFGIEKWDPRKKKDKKEQKEKEKKPGVDIWHWKDDPIQPRQKKTYTSDKNYAFLCSWVPGVHKFNRITDTTLRKYSITGDGIHVLVWDSKSYEPQFKLQYVDYYLTDARTGRKTEILKHHIANVSSSPDGKYLYWFRDKNWWTYEVATGKKTNLTEALGVPFWNIRDDHPAAERPSFGNGGWTQNDKEIFLYDEYDVWLVRPDGSKNQKLTSGRENRIRYRLVRTDFDEKYIDPGKPVYFSVFGDTTKQSGFAVRLPKKKVEVRIYQERSISALHKAKNSDQLIYVAQSYTESPNIYYTDPAFNHPRKLTNTNPQQKNYAWGKATLVSFKNRDGKKLQGVLHYPAKYDPGKKYPMLVYIYEIRSNSLHRYIVPSPKSFYNITNYVQQGYFVFQPDIVYQIDHPGESAVDCVVPAVEKVIATGMIDKNRIGIMGHSWGAYQTSFIITQTNLFSAAVAGAPLTDMISMYNSIYWNTGTPDQQIFETSQGRLSRPWWQMLKEYMDNSPMFQASKINTPLLVAFGDQDGAVDWHQGIEMYITMRRMEKPMIMLVYAGENHAVRKKENMLDYTRRINEFFDYYLLGKPPKPWITNGVKYIDKKKTEGK